MPTWRGLTPYTVQLHAMNINIPIDVYSRII